MLNVQTIMSYSLKLLCDLTFNCDQFESSAPRSCFCAKGRMKGMTVHECSNLKGEVESREKRKVMVKSKTLRYRVASIKVKEKIVAFVLSRLVGVFQFTFQLIYIASS